MKATRSHKRANMFRARAQLTKLDMRRAKLVQVILNNRTARCAPRCKGWFIDQSEHNNIRPVRCDECAYLNGYADVLDDDGVCVLPTVKRAWDHEINMHLRNGGR